VADSLHTHPKVPLKCKNGDGGIYGILNRNSGKLYVGSAICLRKRWNSHRQSLNGNEIARFDSVSKANIAMGREKASAINQVLSGLLKTAFGFKWRKLHE